MFAIVYKHYTSGPERESLKEVNARLREICSDKPIVGIRASTMLDNLIVQCTTADDVQAMEQPTLTATIYEVEPNSNDLEGLLDKILKREEKKHNEDEGRINVTVELITCVGAHTAWVVAVAINGDVDAGEDDDEGGGDEGEDPDDDGGPREMVVVAPEIPGFVP